MAWTYNDTTHPSVLTSTGATGGTVTISGTVTASGAATVSGQPGAVRSHTSGGVTVFRFIPAPYAAGLDGFYSGFDGTTLSGLIVSRG